MRQLAGELGCSPMTPYRYFRDKDAILAAVRADGFNRLSEALEVVARAPGDARQRAAASGEVYIAFAFGNPEFYRLMFDRSEPDEDGDPELAAASLRARRAMTAYVEDLVTEGVFEGDATLIGHMFWAAIHGIVMLQLAGRLSRPPDAEAIRRAMFRAMAAGLQVLGKRLETPGAKGPLET